MIDGLFLIDKTNDCTSHDVVQRIRRIVRQKKIGHCGTLDPGATGLLVATAGKATRLTRFLIRAPKVYAGDICFGSTTDTYDRHGTIVEQKEVSGLVQPSIDQAIQELIGTFDQPAPPFSAKKHKGVKYYEMARRGEPVPESAKSVTVFDFRATSDLDGATLPFELSCSSGTYVRSLAHVLGQKLGFGAHLAELRRLQVGPFRVEDAIGVEALASRIEADSLEGPGWIPLDEIPLPFGELAADSQQEQRIAHGHSVLFRQMEGEAGDWVKLVDRRGHLLAVGTVSELLGRGNVGVVQPKIVFSQSI